MTAWWVGEEDLKDEQLKVLDIPFGKNVLVIGPPGSGKTNLLLLRANHIHIAEEPEFYIVAYTSLLANFIRTGATQYAFPNNKIITEAKLLESVLGDHGIRVPRKEGENFQDRQKALHAAMAALMESGKGKSSYPVLFIDEAQDYSLFQLSVFFYLADSVCLSADARQGIYETDGNDLESVKSRCDPTIELTYHFRVGKKILAVADKIMMGKFGHVPMLDTSQYREDLLPSTVDVVKGSLQEQIRQAAERLAFQLKAYPNEMLGVLVPRRNNELATIWSELLKHPAISDRVTNAHSDDFDPKKPIWISTIHSAKGLEFRSVHILAADTIRHFHAQARRLAFTAVTRAKTALIVYHEGELLPFLASALAVKSDEKIGIAKLFGTKK